jgi:hypothetical protein
VEQQYGIHPPSPWAGIQQLSPSWSLN